MKNSNDLDCRETANRLYEFIDGELTADVEEAVRTHLADCGQCTTRHSFEKHFLRFLRARTRARAAPQHLRKQVFEAILCEEDQPGSN